MFKTEYPMREITVDMTNECPMRCNRCPTKSPLYKEGKILSPDELIEIAITELNKKPYEKHRLKLSGGEPLLVLEQSHIDKLMTCKNIKELFINTSGYLGIKDFTVKPNVLLFYRFKSYGDRRTHENTTLVTGRYEKLIQSIEDSIKKGYRTELTTPASSEQQIRQVIEVARLHKNLKVRLSRDVSYTNDSIIRSDGYNTDLDCDRQRKIAMISQTFYPGLTVSCSLKAKCLKTCEYPKLTILANGKFDGCAIFKNQKV